MTDPELNRILQHHVSEGLMTHAFAAAGDLAKAEPEISLLLSPDGRDVFDLASLTKALVTTPLVWEFCGPENIVDQNISLKTWSKPKRWPFPVWLQDVKVRSLLRHCSGLPPWRNFWVNRLGLQETPQSWEEREHLVAETLHRLNPEGIRTEDAAQLYSDVGFIILGAMLERNERACLSDLFRDWQIRRLGQAESELRFHGSRWAPDRSITSGYCQIRRRQLVGEVHDENCAALGGEAGHCGIFGTGMGLCRYLHRWFSSESGRRLLEANVKLIIPLDKTPDGQKPNEALLGLRQGADFSSETFFNGHTAGHLGFTGTAFWVHPQRGKYAILLTNRTACGRINPAIRHLRRAVFQQLASLL